MSTKEATKQQIRVDKARRFKVVFLNDDYTTFDFVMSVLMNFFGKLPLEAEKTTKEIHEKGKAVAGIFSKEVAEEKKQTVEAVARQREFPLKLMLEPEE